jgi:uncharacterized protein with ParB-like and HNH nuclease domain
MAYQTPITIKNTIDEIKKRHYVLPSIQREFVWDTEQIETLFDSLMRDYPISTFLFWKVQKSKIKDFQFYEFLKTYHEKDSRHNRKVDLTSDEDVIAVLDGQQRMTSIYLALTGSYARKLPYHRKDSAQAYPVKKLYLNLLKPSDDLEVDFDFRFLTEDEAKSSDGYFWFECSKILEMTDAGKPPMFLMKAGLMDTSKYSSQQGEFAMNTLNGFFNVVHQKGTISYYLEESEELDKVLQIFIRINSGGTKLSYSDLLLSIATAQWKEKDAREVIHAFVDEINLIGDRFSFTKDNVLKACLVLADFDVKFKSDNFNVGNMEFIEKNWDGISESIRSVVQLISSFGYAKENLLSNNVIVPIAYFVHKNKFASDILSSTHRAKDRAAIKQWLARVSLKGTFSSTTDSIYPAMRTLINGSLGRFPLEEIIRHYDGHPKSITFSDADIDNLLDQEYGKAKTYCVLTLLYPGLDNSFKFDQDHIHPKGFFTKKNLRKIGLDETKIEDFLKLFNQLPNLQLLQGQQNQEKSDKPFAEWIKNVCSSEEQRHVFLRAHHISPDESLELEDFLTFTSNRRESLKQKLREILGV